MLSVTQARQTILENISPLETEPASLERANHRVLRHAIVADSDFPPFDRSAMDGYAIASVDSPGYSVVGTSLPGSDPSQLPLLQPSDALRVFTGAPLPGNTLRVIPQEITTRTESAVRINGTLPSLSHIRRKGEDSTAGSTLVAAPCRLGPIELSIAALAGQSILQVARQPRVLHIATGDEIVAPDATPAPGQIRDSNSTLIRELVQQAGGVVAAQFRLGDHPEQLINEVRTCTAAYDLLLVSGGASVGDHDFTAQTFESLGYEIVFREVNVRPGKPLIFARRTGSGNSGPAVAFGIPGNPVSHFVVFHLFIRPLLETWLGLPACLDLKKAPLTEALFDTANARETYWPAKLVQRDALTYLQPLNWNSSGHLSSLIHVDALIQIPPNSVSFSQNTWLPFLEI